MDERDFKLLLLILSDDERPGVPERIQRQLDQKGYGKSICQRIQDYYEQLL